MRARMRVEPFIVLPAQALPAQRRRPTPQLSKPHGEERREAARLEPWPQVRWLPHPSRRVLRTLLRMRVEFLRPPAFAPVSLFSPTVWIGQQLACHAGVAGRKTSAFRSIG